MLDKSDIEVALLIKVVEAQDFNILLKNDITIEHFTDRGKQIYSHIQDYLDTYNEYMHIHQIRQKFNIDIEEYNNYKNYGTIQFLIDELKSKYASEQITNKVQFLNANSNLVAEQPYEFIKKFDSVNDDLKNVGLVKKSVNLLDNLEGVLQLDANNVIKTGFKELDDKLIGWNKGEELAILMGRPRTG